MTPSELQQAKALADAATAGPWSDHEWRHWADPSKRNFTIQYTATDKMNEGARFAVAVVELHGSDGAGSSAGNAAFIAASRTLVPALVAEVERLTRERDEARRHLDDRINWQLSAVLHLQTFRTLYDTALAMHEGHEGCVTQPPCGSCFRCDFDKAVEQAKIEVATGVDEFIQESAGFWGRFAAKMQKERDAALRELERWRHGQQVEGDYVCPRDLEVDSLRALLVEACDLATEFAGRLSGHAHPAVYVADTNRISAILAAAGKVGE